jgi:DNA-binding NarL/FixJ family response regulator
MVAAANSTKSLVLIDKLRFTRECLADLLESQLPQFQIVGIAGLEGAQEELPFSPDVVLLNAHLAGVADPVLASDLAAIYRIAPDAPVLLLTDNAGVGASPMVEGPLAGIFPFECGFSLLVAAIGLVAAGGQFYAPSAPPKRAIVRRREVSLNYSV